jgi:hypothetical protein
MDGWNSGGSQSGCKLFGAVILPGRARRCLMDFVQPSGIRLAVRHALKCDRSKDLAGKCLLACISCNIIGGHRATKIAAKSLAVDACPEHA